MFTAAVTRRAPMVPVFGLIAAAWLFTLLSPMEHSSPRFALGWTAMAMAMMLPTVAPVAMYAADGSALRAIWFSAGYIVVWVSVAPIAFAAMSIIEWSAASVALVWIAVGVYQLTPVVRRALETCHQRRRCERPMRFGVKQGFACVLSCLPLMVVSMLTVMVLQPSPIVSVLLLAVLTVFMALEKRPGLAWLLPVSGAAFIALAAIFLVLAPGADVHIHAASQMTNFHR